jgi:hypothetical protein
MALYPRRWYSSWLRFIFKLQPSRGAVGFTTIQNNVFPSKLFDDGETGQ